MYIIMNVVDTPTPQIVSHVLMTKEDAIRQYEHLEPHYHHKLSIFEIASTYSECIGFQITLDK